MKQNDQNQYIPTVADIYKLVDKLFQNDTFREYSQVFKDVKYSDDSDKRTICVLVCEGFLGKLSQLDIIDVNGRLYTTKPFLRSKCILNQETIDDNFIIGNSKLNDVWNLLYGRNYDGK